MADTIDSNVTGLAIAKEASLKTLPGSVFWHEQEPNSYSDFGGDIKTVAREPISQTRQRKKGGVVDVDASGGFNTDVTKTNLAWLLQGFFFAAAREKPSTRPLNYREASSGIAITSVTASSDTYAAAAGLSNFNLAGYIVNSSGFTNSANNGLKVVASATGTGVAVDNSTVDEASPPADAKLEVVGFQFTSGDCVATVVSGRLVLTSTTANMNDKGLIVGEWIFIGGGSTNSFATAPNGYARISAIATKSLTFDECTFEPTADAGAGRSIRIFFGTVIKNESDPNLIVRSSYQLERRLGLGPTDIQAEYLEGAVANELTLNLPKADKLNADLSFVALDNTHRSGESGDEVKAGTHVDALGEDAINTSSDVYRIKLSILDAADANPTPLFAYLDSLKLTISNGVTPDKAIGVLGGFDTSAGNFIVNGDATAYFNVVDSVRSIRENADLQLNAILAAENCGQILDIPLLGLGGGRLNIEPNQKIKVPLTQAAAQNANNYTLMYVNFPYLPTIAMPA